MRQMCTKPGLEQVRRITERGGWVAQSVECLTLDLSSGLHLRVVSSSPVLASTLLKKKKRGREGEGEMDKTYNQL